MSSKVPLVKFNNGQSCPILGPGTWQANPSKVANAVSAAIDIGCRHIDCTYVYGNEKEVGDAIKEKINHGAVKRYGSGQPLFHRDFNTGTA